MKDGKFDKDKCLEGMAPMLTKVPDDKKEEVKTKLAECYSESIQFLLLFFFFTFKIMSRFLV